MLSTHPPFGERPVAVDLFSGAGGLSLGFEQAGFDIAAAVEIDPVHAAAHEFNFPYGKTICGSVIDLSGDDVRRGAGLVKTEVDLVVGGPPCQGFSLMGHRVLEDPRNQLVFHFARLVRELQPRAFVMENVPGMAVGYNVLDELVRQLEDSGYTVTDPPRVLDATAFGVPQARKRLFLMGTRRGLKPAIYPDPITNGPRPHRSSQLPLGELPPPPTVKCAIGDLPDVDRDDSLFDTDEMHVSYGNACNYALRLRGELNDPNDLSYRRARSEGILSGCRRANHTVLSRTRFGETKQGQTEPVSRFFKLDPDGLCNTLRAGTASDRGAFTAPRPIHPEHPRCITVREAARLHSFPDWFRFHTTIWHGFRQIGNSVPPLLGRAVGASMAASLGRTVAPPTGIVLSGDERLLRMNMRQAAAYFGVSSTVVAQRSRKSHG